MMTPTRRDFLKSAIAIPALAYVQDPKPAANGDTAFADFESGTFDGWTLSGNCWTKEPHTTTTIPGITGFQGKRFLCTLHPKLGTSATGKAVSREFTIEKPFINFLIGGGHYPGEACLNLVVDGKVVRSETGNDSAEFSRVCWDVYELTGKTAHLELVDNSKSDQRGYVMLDDIHLSDRPMTDLQHNLDKIGQEAFQKLGTPCLGIAIVQDGSIVAITTLGVNDLRNPESLFTTNSIIRVGSVSKPICGYVIAQVVSNHKLNWDTKLRDVCPDICAGTAHLSVNATLANFVSHTSGVKYRRYQPSAASNDVALSGVKWREMTIREDLLRSEANGQPGEKTEYSGGMDFAAVMAERATGETFESLLSTILTAPNGLNTVRLGVSSVSDLHPMSVGQIFDKSSGRFVREGFLYGGGKSLPKYRAETTGAIAGSFLEIAKASFVCSGLSAKDHQNGVFRALRTLPLPRLSNTTLGGWGLINGGLAHNGSYGFELAHAQVDDKTRSLVLFYTNGIYEAENGQSEQPDFGKYISRVFRLIGPVR
ncbi:MAG: serine hydrolase domain-containing protein [Chthonomonadales bacterium]